MPVLTSRLSLAAVATAAALAVGTPVAYATWDRGPAASAAPSSVHRGAAYVETRLFFGTARADGRPPVTDRQFNDFVDRAVTPRFPQGLTVQRGRGQWRDQHGTIERERSYELIVLYPRSEARVRDRDVERIRATYEREFGQESVARADDDAWVDF